MVGKNNKQARWSKSANTFKRYSLKKLSVGVASVVIGTGVAWASSTTVHAAEEGTEVVTGDGEKEAPVESAVPTEAPVVGGDESSSHDAVADLVNQEEQASHLTMTTSQSHQTRLKEQKKLLMKKKTLQASQHLMMRMS